ncbi:MAG: hypothetical protein Ct9H300mP9_0890 [Candidatus Neomarinimicrobiota bacterium]|nr:MAG: hypothetical protein Ct9H300mP9_0890 [Candidatus Neomarinimicrobiota bacterium]
MSPTIMPWKKGCKYGKKIGDGEVVVVSMGPERVLRVIREGLAKGADRGIYLEESGQSETDPLSIAKSFASVLKDESFDLILTGLQSDDTGMGQTGVLLGELLGMSTATLGIETNIVSGAIRVKRELESGWFQWVKPLSASFCQHSIWYQSAPVPILERDNGCEEKGHQGCIRIRSPH